MIELRQDQLVISFPEVHPSARFNLTFQRTLRIPDDGRDYPLPPGLGGFPMLQIDEFAARVPKTWRRHGGVMIPMFQAEAMWLSFNVPYDADRRASYPFALKVAAGKINAVTGQAWSPGLNRVPQDYMVLPRQPWLDGFCVEKGIVRQFVAMPLGTGYSAEEQITGKAEHGGLQILAYPMKREVFERRFPIQPRHEYGEPFACCAPVACLAPSAAMGLAPGGRMKQEIYEDRFNLDDWDLEHSSRCFVHLTNSLAWRAITGEAPPTIPPTAQQYSAMGLPWFDYYEENAKAVSGSGILSKLKSVFGLGQEKRQNPLPENKSCEPKKTLTISPKQSPYEVREGTF